MVNYKALFWCTLPAILFLVIFLLTGCSNPEETTMFLHSQGFTKIKTTGYKPFTCGKDDLYVTGFTAKDTDYSDVSGTVCDGWVSGKHIEFD